MTLAAIWTETKAYGNRSLCFASDSRTTPGPLEGVTKVMLFGREDIAGVWSGDYRYASLLLHHFDAMFTASEAMRRRDVDVSRAFRQAAMTVQQHIAMSLKPRVPIRLRNTDAQLPERTAIVLGGFSVMEVSHMLLRLDWTPADRRWRVRISKADPASVMFIGDGIRSANATARQIRAHRDPPASKDWHMEPLAAIHNACEDDNRATVGGSIQMAKAYMHGSTHAYGFIDPVRSNKVSVRATQVDKRASLELAATDRLIDLSAWQLRTGCFTRWRSAPRSGHAILVE